MTTVAWNDVCGNTSLFWDSNATWFTNTPTIPECFQKTALVWASYGLLWLMLPVEIYVVISSRTRYIPFSVVNVTKMVVNVTLILLAVVEFSNALNTNSQGIPLLSADIYNPVIKSLTFLLCVVLVHIERIQGIQTSGVLFLFWVSLAAAESITFVDLLKAVINQVEVGEPHFIVHMIYFPLMVMQCALALVSDVKPQYREVDDSAQNSCPKNRASFLSKLYFHWLNGLMQLGATKRLESRDVWSSSSEVLCHNTVHRFLQQWQIADNNQIVLALWRVVAKIHKMKFLIATLLILMSDILIYLNPLILELFIKFISGKEPTWHGLLYAFALFANAAVTSLFNWQAIFLGTSIAVAVQSALVSAIYRKTLVLSNMSRHVTSLGQYVNMIGVDASRLSNFLQYFTYCVSLPVQLAIGMWMLYSRLGESALVGLAVFLVLNIFSLCLAKKNKALQVEQLNIKDERIKLINDTVSGIKLVKLLAWEKSILRNIENARERELRVLSKSLYLESATTFIWNVAPYMVTLVTLVAFVFIEKNNFLDPSKVFVTLTIFNILRLPMAHLPAFIAHLVQTSVSVKRLTDFLGRDELDTSSVSHCTVSESVIISDGWFSWGKTENCILRDINFRVDKGLSVAVVGRVGTGKTSLLFAILGEMNKMHGAVNVHGNIAYVSQTAWILNATLKENVVFGRKFDGDLYRMVIKACALDKELDGNTEIGEKGTTLSGGQKQRVSLARAVYTQADIYLLDDPLGALDARVAQFVFDNVLGPRGILKHKTRIMTMNGINFLDAVDTVLFVKDGTIAESGSWDELQNNNSAALAEMIEEKDVLAKAVGWKPEQEDILVKKVEPHRGVSIQRTSMEEQIVEGRVGFATYYSYVKRMDLCLVLVVCICLPLAYAFYAATSVWMSDWSMDYKRVVVDHPMELRNVRLLIYGGLGFSYGFFLLVGSLAVVDGGIRASSAFHQSALLAVLRSPLSFFDANPSGRIVNRFSKDIDLIDSQLPSSLRNCLFAALEIASGLTLICVYLPWILPLVAVLAVFYYVIQKHYVTIVDQLKRLESVTRSLLYSHLSESYYGLATLRAYRRQNKFIRHFESLLDENLKHIYYAKTVFRYVGVRLDIMGNTIVLATTLFGIYQRNFMDPGTIAMLVTFSISINFTFTALVQSSGVLVSNIVSVERLNEYTTLLEEDAQVDGSKPRRKIENQWPEFGTISFNNLCLRYRPDLDMAIKHLSCSIMAGEKIGIVGRTGSGKTTLAQSLVRLLEPTSGSILIDCIDISGVRLRDLRSKLNFVPQEPILFAGTFRSNLDPLDEHEDESLWKVLQQTNLANFIDSLPEKLNNNVLTEGENLSVGQRQLICLARALLRKSTTVLVLDEATSALDPTTEDLVRAVIKREFARATVLTISHRLTSVMDCDRVMVIDNGVLVEFDSPKTLMANDSRFFKKLAQAANLIYEPSQEGADSNNTS